MHDNRTRAASLTHHWPIYQKQKRRGTYFQAIHATFHHDLHRSLVPNKEEKVVLNLLQCSNLDHLDMEHVSDVPVMLLIF